MKTRFNTGDTVFIPATITNAIIKENKIFYGIKESDSIVDENICRTEDQVIHNQTAKISIHVESRELDETMKKLERLGELIKAANSLLDELTSKSETIKLSTIRI